MNEPVVIIGGGPAGVAAALELSRHAIAVVLLEADEALGGLSRTRQFQGARFDVGPHRFFTKNREIRELWRQTLGDDFLDVDRLTRIFYGGQFFQYPLSLGDTLRKVGPVTAAGFAASYLSARLRAAVAKRSPETFEEWVVAQFGRRLFEAFFQTYTEKVWGIPCRQIGAEWAAQRIKGLSLAEAIRNALRRSRGNGSTASAAAAKPTVKTLVERFQYPRLGAGQMYEHIAARARGQSAQVLLNTKAVGLRHERGRVVAVLTEPGPEIPCAHVLTSNPITEVVLGCDPAPPPAVSAAARALRYRGHLCVNLLVEGELFPDQWIYVHAREVQLGRVASYANFSADMRAPSQANPITAEYFQFPEDELYQRDDEALIEHAKGELHTMGIVQPDQVSGGFVVRHPVAYPVLELGYAPQLKTLREFLQTLENLHPIGRGGLFKYNNQDHSIATGLLAARNIIGAGARGERGAGAPGDVWEVNIDAEYLEAGKAE